MQLALREGDVEESGARNQAALDAAQELGSVTVAAAAAEGQLDVPGRSPGT